MLNKSITLLAMAMLLLSAAANASSEKFLSMADIHFTPFAMCKNVKPCHFIKLLRQAPYQKWENLFEKNDHSPISYYQDTNYPLLKSTLTQLNKVNQEQHPVFALVLGDFLAHDFRHEYIAYSGDRSLHGYQSFVKKTMQFLMLEIKQIFPHMDVYAVVGNNDSYQGDYAIDPSGPFFKDTALSWANFVDDPANRQALTTTFPRAGYYAVTVPNNRNLKIIILNSVLFSTASTGKRVDQAANEQLHWLHQELLSAKQRNQKVILAFHIPFGVDVFTTIKTKFGVIQDFWKEPYSKALNQDLKEFSLIVKQILPAHLHMDAFQIVPLTQPHEIPISFTPSISPILGNNPGFKIYRYDHQTFQLENFDAYYYLLNDKRFLWSKEYSFNQIYQQTVKNAAILIGYMGNRTC